MFKQMQIFLKSCRWIMCPSSYNRCQLSANILVTTPVVGVGQESVDISAEWHFTVNRVLVECQSMTVGSDSMGSLLAMHMLVIHLLSIHKLTVGITCTTLEYTFQLTCSIHISAVADNRWDLSVTKSQGIVMNQPASWLSVTHGICQYISQVSV